MKRIKSLKLPRSRGFVKINKVVVIATVAIIAVALVALFASRASGAPADRLTVEPARDTQDVNREFSFPITDEDGDEVSQTKLEILKAELRNELISAGAKIQSVDGRTFLILNLKITNDFSQGIDVDSRDYIRLSVNGNQDEWLAPEFHNDPVNIQAISTKNTRVGFPVNETDRDFVLQVGEIGGDKEQVPLDLTY